MIYNSKSHEKEITDPFVKTTHIVLIPFYIPISLRFGATDQEIDRQVEGGHCATESGGGVAGACPRPGHCGASVEPGPNHRPGKQSIKPTNLITNYLACHVRIWTDSWVGMGWDGMSQPDLFTPRKWVCDCSRLHPIGKR